MSEHEATRIACDFIAKHEGFRARAYADPLHGWRAATIGYGTTVYPDGTPVRKGDTCDNTEALGWLRHHVQTRCLPHLRSIPTWPHMHCNQQAALVSFCYNLGNFYKRPKRESITRLCCYPEWWRDTNKVINTFVLYRNPGSAAERGLRRRRLEEADLFLTEDE
jgi:GH24 family phage-related lysozyme (muramidase)